MLRIPAVCAVVAFSNGTHLTAQTTKAQIAITSAASYEQAVAPSSLGTIFGAGLASTTVSARLGPDGQLPTQLGGVSVQVNGQAAPLIFVSPSQINFVVPDKVATGTASVLVRSANGASTQSGTVPVQNVVPALFSLDSTGTGPGAIFNAITYAPGPFLVETPQNPGADKRTRLLVYATGLRYAGNLSHDPSITNVAAHVTAQGRDPSGNVIPLPVEYAGKLPVEYAGPAPGFPGLDQVNILLPAELDGVGSVSLTLAADSVASSTVTFFMNGLLPSSIRVASLTLAQSEVVGAADIPATVLLNGRAGLGGFTATLQSNNPSIQVPGFITIPNGQASSQFTVHASSVLVGQTGTITGSGNGSSAQAKLQLDPSNSPLVVGLTFTPAAVAGGSSVVATVSLSSTAPPGGAVVRISSDNQAAQPPLTVNVPLGQTTLNFNITTTVVTSQQTATITATIGSSSLGAKLLISPPIAIVLSPATVVGGTAVTGTVTLATPASQGGADVVLRSDDFSAQVPALGIQVAAGQTSASFTIQTIAVVSQRKATITASYGGNTGSAILTVNPLGAVMLASLILNPTSVTGGTPVTATVTLTDVAPIEGITVLLNSDNPFAQLMQPFVTVPSGLISATFTVTTVQAFTTQTATIKATYRGTSKTATLTIQ